jgi:BirA family transcriptional regulator, biotin operon repressor / biotin---[acetyl-CoA-carboxylase] ligase
LLIDPGGTTLLHLAKSALAQAYRLTHHAQLGSTNDEALSRAAAGDAGRLWIVADEQTKGRGRHGRQWSSPPGNLYASLLLIDPAPVHKAPELGFVAGVALLQCLRDVLGSDPLLSIKWPNDILHAGAKLAGILLESTQLKGGGLACVIGIGVNCSSHPTPALYPATDLAEIGTLLGRREDILLRLSECFLQWLGIWDEGRDFEAIRAEWLNHAGGLGGRISVTAPSGLCEGIFETIDASGRLILNVDGQMLTVEAGDVFLTPAPMGALAGVQSTAAPVSHEDRR